MTNKATAVRAYTEAGFTLFDCKPDKTPKWTGWRHTSYVPDLEAKNLEDTYAVLLPPDIVVLDYDPRRDNEKTADGNAVKALFNSLGLRSADTFMVRSGSGGYHIYYRLPDGVPDGYAICAKVPGYPAIDVKTNGGFVLAAGSRHPNGSIYSVSRGDVGDISNIPPVLLRALLRDRTAKQDNATVESDDPQTRKRFTNYLTGQDPSGTYAKACYGRELGLSEDAVFEIMAEHYNPRRIEPKTDAELKEKIAHAFEYAQKVQGAAAPENAFTDEKIGEELANNANSHIHWTFSIDKAGNRKLDAVLNNVIGFLSWVPTAGDNNPLYKLFRLNVFTGQIEFTRPAPWHSDFPEPYLTDTDVVKVKEYLTEKHLYVGTELVREGILAVAHTNQYHPVRDWLLSLKWDGVYRLDTLLSTYAGAPESPYTREVGKNTILAAVARILSPGCQHDHMLILEGEQGTGKTSFVRILGGQWYADITIDPSNKDTVQGMIGKWILEASEMEFLKRSDVGSLKRFLTLTNDVVRLSYARYTSTIPRQSIFIGTINPGSAGYLVDTTGNRRFWPVTTGKIETEKLAQDREQIFAEAVVRFNNKEAWHLTDPRIIAIAQGEQATRQAQDFWADIIEYWLSKAEEAGVLPDPLTTDAIAYGALNLSPNRLGRTEGLRISAVMRKLGYDQKQKRVGKGRARYWEKNDPYDDFIENL